MKELYRLDWLVDRAVDSLTPRVPAGAITFRFDDGAIDTVDGWQLATTRQQVLVQAINAIEQGEIKLRNALGMILRSSPAPLVAIKTCAVSRDDALHFLRACGVNAGFLDGKRSDKPQMAGLDEINACRKELRKFARRFAQAEWAEDDAQQIRLGDMCERTYRALNDEFSDRPEMAERIPGWPDGIKPWLREVAPDYAKKPGRPKL